MKLEHQLKRGNATFEAKQKADVEKALKELNSKWSMQ